MNTVERFRAAVEDRDLTAFDGLFDPDVRFFSPVKFTPFEGAQAVHGLLNVLLRTFEEFRYVGQLAGEAEIGAAGRPVESHILIFRAAAGGRQIHGLDLLQLGDNGLIVEFTVMVRPLSAVNALSEAVLAGLAADGIAL
ncbi:nuclear transport factor 2 family protein [Micromonospora sp. WMMA1363]|uniref:nuclear transport factor 2 family protein n=1 Tax=Micromonospora sp. WMMA1363 TaxID=3053985 RepID=UPI00259CA6B0|nr:nuclear transport factor 2 family protein [Micromonospora sp. WMMA1363]MDM4719320.1 nuclear transport factor 2 family protein [Micromonospora sp. WMMA1363]